MQHKPLPEKGHGRGCALFLKARPYAGPFYQQAVLCLALFSFLFFTGPQAGAQGNWECGAILPQEPELAARYISCGNTSDSFFVSYNKQTHPWYSAATSLTPVKTIHVTMVVWHRTNGTGGWPDNATYNNSLRNHINAVNQMYGVNTPATYLPLPGTPFIPDTRIRFMVDSIHHMYNSTYYESSYGPDYYNAYLYGFHPGARKTLNIHLIKGDATSYVGAWGWANLPSADFNMDAGVVTKMGETPLNYTEPSWVGHLAHELGHTLGMNHTYGQWFGTVFYPAEPCNFNDPDFLWDVFGNKPNPYIYGDPLGRMCNTGCDVCPHAGGATNNFMGAGGGNFSPMQIGRMHRVLQGMNVRKYTWGLGTTPYTITQNETWDFNIKVYQDIVIPYGKKLTVKCRMEMAPDARITIQPGGVLEVDGGTITAPLFATRPWQGIEVIGNSSLPQNPQPGSGGIYPQGRLILKNNAVIENARNAVTTWKFNDYNTIGGLITASNATFRNNNRSVEFMSYAFPEKSSFTNCKFVIDGPLLEGYCKTMVTAWLVNGTLFSGNEFECSYTANFGAYPPPKGIFTYDARFAVRPYCTAPPTIPYPCPVSYLKPNKFKGLLYGVEATNGTTYNFVVDSTLFENCGYGVYASSVNLFEVLRSRFDIKPYYGTAMPLGIGNEASTGFKVQNNWFYSSQTNPLSYDFIGTYSKNTGTAFNEIYRNKFQQMKYANVAEGNNWTPSLSNLTLGLKYICNTQTGNRTDIRISDKSTIGLIQGFLTNSLELLPAGNSFSVTSQSDGHISNLGNSSVNYYYGIGTAQQPTLYTPANVSVISTTINVNDTYCPSRLSWGGVISLPTEGFEVRRAAYDRLQQQYDSLLDGGNTAKLVSRITLATTADSSDLYRELVQQAPFLSMDVLYKIADRTDILSQAKIFDICMAAPHCSRDKSFMSYLRSKKAPMPDAMIDRLSRSNTLRTAKDSLEEQMSFYAAEWNRLADENIRYYLEDTAAGSTDSVWIWVSRKGDWASGIILAEREAGMQNYAAARSRLQSILRKTPVIAPELELELNARLDYYKVLSSFQAEGNEYWVLNKTQVKDLAIFAESGQTAAHAQARNILSFFYDYDYKRSISVTEALPSGKRRIVSYQPAQETGKCILSPNPAQDYCMVQYDFSETATDSRLLLQLLTVEGRLMKEWTIEGPKGTSKMDIRDLVPGSYIFTIRSGDHNLKSGVLVIHK